MSTASVSPLPEDLARNMQDTGTWQEFSPVGLHRLCLVTVPYIDFDCIQHNDGRIVVLDVVAEQVAAAFCELSRLAFPINKIQPLDEYGGNDEKSMADNNSSAYCCRPILGSSQLSVHSYGLAVDINPLQNPYIIIAEKDGTATIHPPAGFQYMNRQNKQPGMVEDVMQVMFSHGFTVWGGNWQTPIDYHHFELPRAIAELLAVLKFNDGKRLIEELRANREAFSRLPSGRELQPLLEIYMKSPTSFFDKLHERLLS